MNLLLQAVNAEIESLKGALAYERARREAAEKLIATDPERISGDEWHRLFDQWKALKNQDKSQKFSSPLEGPELWNSCRIRCLIAMCKKAFLWFLL